MALQKQSTRGPYRNDDPIWVSEAVDVSSVDYTPSNNGLFRGLNASVAGLIYIVKANGQTVPEYVVVGWNRTGGQVVKHHGSNTATVIAAALES